MHDSLGARKLDRPAGAENVGKKLELHCYTSIEKLCVQNVRDILLCWDQATFMRSGADAAADAI